MKQVSRWHSIQFKLTMTFLFILLPLVGVSLYSNYYSQDITYNQITERTRGALLTTLEYIEQLSRNMDQQTMLIGSNPNLVDVWQGIVDPLTQEHLYEIHTVQQQLTALINVNGATKEAMIIHGASGNGISTDRGAIKWPRVQEEEWFRQTIDANGGLAIYAPTEDDAGASLYLSSDRIYYTRLLEVFGYNREPNVMILAVEKSELRNIVHHLQTSSNTSVSLFYKDSLVLESNPIPNYRDQLFSISANSSIWTILLEQPQVELFLLPHKLQQLTYVIIAISILLAIWIAWLVYSAISKPLHQMTKALRQFKEGNLTAHITHRRKDEFGYLMDAFNQMSEAQYKLIKEDYEKELRLARSEFSLLQSQINPHFLYNTLDSIYSVAYNKGIDEISEMVINLAQFFRVSLGKGRDSFTLGETVQHLMYYIRVQQIRTDHFTVNIELDEETKDIPVLKSIVQPIVENAIVHGLGRSTASGELRIRSRLKGQLLHIDIEDTGCGISEQKLASLQYELDLITSKSYRIFREEPFSRYFGLKNVKSRIKLYYGEQANLLVRSGQEEGTLVTLILPVKER